MSKSNRKPLVEWTLYKALMKGELKKAEEETVRLISIYSDQALKSALVYIRQAMKAKTKSMSKVFLDKTLAILKDEYKTGLDD